MSLISRLAQWFAPPLPIAPLPAEKVKGEYNRQRIRIFVGIFIGYGASYLIRKNFSLVIPDLVQAGSYSKTQLGWALTSLSVAYGIGKFIMGNFSDRSNPRYFLAMGLIISTLITFLFGFTEWAYSSLAVILILMAINGWGQSMCYPPCVRVLAHWYTIKERSMAMTTWNLSHNLGGALLGVLAVVGRNWYSGDWHSVFFLPASIVVVCIGIVLWLVRDTPQSVGLPSIERYHQEGVEGRKVELEKELSAKEIFFKHIFNNKAIWFLSFANIFVYFVRYGVLDWIPAYLSEVKGVSPSGQGYAYSLFEFAGLASIMLCGLLSKRFFKNRRAPIIIISMFLVIFAILLYWLNPPGHDILDDIALVSVGFLIYGPVVLIGMQAVDVVHKKAVGTATGLTGLFGYMLGTTGANALMGHVVDNFGWDMGFYMLIGACVLSILCLIPIWNAGGEE